MISSWLKCLAVAFLISLTLTSLASAAVPRIINYQGYLKDTTAATPVNGLVDITFSLYDVPIEGTALWSERHAAVPVSSGIYSIRLGSIDPAGNPLAGPFDKEYFLGISVNDGPELTPRQPLTAVPYSMKSITVETVPCFPGDSVTCYSGPESTKNVGRCTNGTRICSPAATFGACTDEVLPTTEICFNYIDDNCDGQIDEGCTFPNGTACSENRECTSGFCADGYCCDLACSGVCQSCGMPGSEGLCTSHPAFTDPEAGCMPYTCNGSGSCSTACVSDASCSAGFYCNPANQCAARQATGAVCSNNSQCISNFCIDGFCCNSSCNGLCETCSGGTCTPIAAGQDPANECPGSGTCGGVCNGAGACTYPPAVTDCGTCQRCSGNGLCLSVSADTDPDNDCSTCRTCDGAGSCKNVVNGSDPQNDCFDQGPCGQDGYCNGAGACRSYSSATVYTPASCSAGTYSLPDTCNGAGGVSDGGTSSCAPYICGATACLTSCTQQSDCVFGNFCDLGDSNSNGNSNECLPKKADGSACSDDARDFECSGGFCSNGFCCASSTGSCCSLPADCQFLAQAAVCDSAATCSGHRVDATCSAHICTTSIPNDPSACNNQTCAPGTCTGTGNLTWTPASVCNGSGVCSVSGSVVSCDDGNICTNDSCGTSTGCSNTNNSYSRACYTGPPATRNVGICRDGTEQCSGGTFGACTGQLTPATEACGGGDESCDGQANEQNAIGCLFYRIDSDQDSYGVSGNTRCYCAPGLAYLGAPADAYTASNAGVSDCNDSNAQAYPGNTEKCSTGFDDNCNGQINEEGAQGCTVYFYDGDRDGYGISSSKCLCVAAAPYDSLYSTDCNDASAAVRPGTSEVCNGIDDNCSGGVDQAEVPVGTLCPLTANVTATACNGASGCAVTACSQYWYDVDTVYSNGCEVRQDLNDRTYSEDTCDGAVWLGNLVETGYGVPNFFNITGNSVPDGDNDWFYANVQDNSGNASVQFSVFFGNNPGVNYQYDVYRGGCATSALAIKQTGTFISSTPGFYYVRVHRSSGSSPNGENYTITLNDGYN